MTTAADEKAIFFLSASVFELEAYLQGRLVENERYCRGALKRLMTYCVSGDPMKGAPFARWISGQCLTHPNPKIVLERTAEVFQRCLDGSIDPWHTQMPLEDIPIVRSDVKPFPQGKRIITLPIFKSQEPSEKEVISVRRCVLDEAAILELLTANIGIMIGGRSGSGKSTLAASLAAEMQNIAESLATRTGWEWFPFVIETVNLDLATPTVDAIQAGFGKDREKLAKMKRPWTRELALEALKEFACAKSRAHVTIADLPGGKIGAITEITAELADVAVLVVRDWSHMSEWNSFIHRMGIALVAQARSRTAGEGVQSVVTRYHEGRIIAGRATDLDRVNRSWDLFISWLAEFLLFDILPTFVRERRKRLKRIADHAP